jgi:predicted enzyme related to lactoylglutathione lyase
MWIEFMLLYYGENERNFFMLNLNTIMLGSENAKQLITFYKSVLEKDPDMQDGDWAGFQVGSCFLAIGPHDKVKGTSTNPERVFFNFETNDVQQEFLRIKALGATVIKEPYSPDPDKAEVFIATFADPDGNYFQLASPWE